MVDIGLRHLLLKACSFAVCKQQKVRENAVCKQQMIIFVSHVRQEVVQVIVQHDV